MKNVAFVMHVFDEPPDEVAINVAAVKLHYPLSPFFLIYDGVPKQNHVGVTDRLMLLPRDQKIDDKYPRKNY